VATLLRPLRGANGDAYGIVAFTNDGNSPISIENSARVTVTSAGTSGDLYGITAFTNDGFSPISIVNSGEVTAASTGTDGDIYGILAFANDGFSPISIVNSGNITTSGSGNTLEPLNGGIFADTFGLNSPLSLENSGNITSTGLYNDVFGIFVDTRYDGSPLSIVNSGNISVDAGGRAFGIRTFTGGAGSPLSIENSGGITAMVTGPYSPAYGIYAFTYGPNSPISVVNGGDISAEVRTGQAFGIRAFTGGVPLASRTAATSRPLPRFMAPPAASMRSSWGADSSLFAMNRGDIVAAGGDALYDFARGIDAHTYGDNSPISVVNSGDITVTSTLSNSSAFVRRAFPVP
jgi:hypothetical protein